MSDPNLITGLERSEDAGIYKLRDDLAIIQTVDFFTPIVDDPYDFGRIAVANALSDVYAKGGRPLTAMNIVCFPIKKLGAEMLHRIMEGGLDKMREAGVVLVGGHSVDDPEPKYGLSVTGVIHPELVVKNNTAHVGDKLILTKKLGVGIISTALKAGKADAGLMQKAIQSMATLNKIASETMMRIGVHACTDVTGFGFLGHACEMLEDTSLGMVIDARAVPYFAEARSLAESGYKPGGLERNRQYRIKQVQMSPSVPAFLQDILFDPQTSGGLLMAVEQTKAEELLQALQTAGVTSSSIVGEVSPDTNNKIVVK